MLTQYKGLPHQVYIILLARIISAMGMFVYPFLTLFLSSRLGFSELDIGKFLLIVSLSYIPAAMIGGKLADRFSRKNTYLVAMVCSDMALLSAGFLSESSTVIYLLLVAFFFMNMSMPILAAMMMDLTAPVNRQESFSLVYLGINIGGAIGPMAAGFMFENHTPWIFWGEAILNLIALTLIFTFIKDTKPGEEDMKRIADDTDRQAEAASNDSMLRIMLRSPILICFGICASALAFSYSQVSFMLPLQMEDLFGISAGAKYFGILCSLNCVVVVLMTPFLVLFTKRNSPLLNMSISGVLYMLGFGLYGIAGHLAVFYILTAVWTFGEIVSATNTGVYIANHSPVTHRARFQSIFDIVQGTGRAIGPLTMGYFLMSHTIPEAWRVVGIICFIAAVALFVLRRVELKKIRNR
ncbi:MAG: MFS transporter [Anaerovoracaceae bacterium]